MQRFGLRLLVAACFGCLCARNSTQTGLIIIIKFINYMSHDDDNLMMIVTDTLSNLLVADVPQNCRLTGYMCSRY